MPNPTDIFGNLAWLNKKVKNLIGAVNSGGTTPGIDDVLSQNQDLSANRSFLLNSNKLEINPGYQLGLKLDGGTLETSLTGRYTTIGNGNTLDLNAGSTLTISAGNHLNIDGINIYTNCETHSINFGSNLGASVLKLEYPLLNTGHNTLSANKLKVTIDSVDYYIPLYT